MMHDIPTFWSFSHAFPTSLCDEFLKASTLSFHFIMGAAPNHAGIDNFLDKKTINNALCLQSLHQLSDITFPILNYPGGLRWRLIYFRDLLMIFVSCNSSTAILKIKSPHQSFHCIITQPLRSLWSSSFSRLNVEPLWFSYLEVTYEENWNVRVQGSHGRLCPSYSGSYET
ncbi:hypothetical protein BDR03DRAFT_958860 [Suillus americanus]|nr:hypothetical protein BDR03DRAFT_958860 [Suillus americanus]